MRITNNAGVEIIDPEYCKVCKNGEDLEKETFVKKNLYESDDKVIGCNECNKYYHIPKVKAERYERGGYPLVVDNFLTLTHLVYDEEILNFEDTFFNSCEVQQMIGNKIISKPFRTKQGTFQITTDKITKESTVQHGGKTITGSLMQLVTFLADEAIKHEKKFGAIALPPMPSIEIPKVHTDLPKIPPMTEEKVVEKKNEVIVDNLDEIDIF